MLATLKRVFRRHGPEAPVLKVLVHCFSWCSCGSETYSANHIKLKTFKRSVKPGQAVALSYGVGDFDRQKHLFGHVDGPESKAVRLEFGGEWETEGLMGALVALSEKHGGIWLDQLSIPQDTASIRLHLQNMPQIYRGFEVVVLLPNAPCYCLKDAFDSWTSEGSHAWENGDFARLRVARECLNAFPVSSYHFRLWTKQEFSYARTISAHYCGAPGKCLRGTLGWSLEELDTLLQGSGHLSRWASWKYALCIRMTSDQSENATALGHSTFMVAHGDGETHLASEVFAFFLRKEHYSSKFVVHRTGANLASFLLGERLHSDWLEFEGSFMPSNLQTDHVASLQKDLALAVLPAADGYRLPQGHAEMTLPDLIDDGIEQCQRHQDTCFTTKLPRGLFQDGICSMGPKPSLHLRTENIRCLKDVYGSIAADTFPNIAPPRLRWVTDILPSVAPPRLRWVTLLYLRDVHPRPSRLTLSKTYAEAFGSVSTAEVCDFVRRLPERLSKSSSVRAYKLWAAEIHLGGIPAPIDNWPSPAHEQAIFEESLIDMRPWRWWWPEVDHEKACYNFMCDYVCIHPDVAREKRLGLVVKTSDPACIGFVSRVVYDKIRATEQYQYRHGSPAPRLWRRQNGIDPEDWLTITLDKPTAQIHRTLEVVNNRRDFPEHPVNKSRSRYKTSVPRYVVRGVWYKCLGDDECIGAELTEHHAEDYDAILI
jgi:hypothetical protein